MTLQTHTVTVGDTLTPLGAQLKQKNASGTYEAVDLTNLVVKFKMVAEDGTEVVAETSTGVTVTDADDGKVQYDFQAADVATAGVYYGWFSVWDEPLTGTGAGERDTYPAGGRQLRIDVVESE